MIGGDSELRTTFIIDFYKSRIPNQGKTFVFVPDNSALPPDWYLFTQRPHDPHLVQLSVQQWNACYQIEAEFPHYGLSGRDWTLFHRVGAKSSL